MALFISLETASPLALRFTHLSKSRIHRLDKYFQNLSKAMKKYLVGGAVRDQLLGYPVKERDWVVVGETPETMTQSRSLTG